MSQFIKFEEMIGSFYAENLEYFLLGDLNVDLTSTTASPIKNKLKEILDIYGIKQLINEPTRIMSSSRTLIDLCLINTPSHVVHAGVLSLPISNHSLIYAIGKAHYVQGVPKTVDIKSMKQFNREHYLRDLEQKNWHNVYCSVDPNVMWKIWKENLILTLYLFCHYYLDQQQGHGMPIFRGRSWQRGHGQMGYGLGGLFRSLTRAAMPIVKSEAKAIGNIAVNSGANFLGDLLAGTNAKEATKASAMDGCQCCKTESTATRFNWTRVKHKKKQRTVCVADIFG